MSWSVRAIYTDYIGWFDGNATNLFPLSTKDRAAAILDLAGGEAPVISKARAAFEQHNFQLAAELADYVLAVHPENRDATTLKGAGADGTRASAKSARTDETSTCRALSTS